MNASALTVSGLHKRFGGIVVADAIDLSLHAGHVLGLIGPNGAGKTSLFNLIAGVVPPDSGSIHMNGVQIDNKSVPQRAAAGLARTWQHIRLFPSLTVLDNLLLATRRYPGETPLSTLAKGHGAAADAVRDRAFAQLERVRMVEAAHRMPGELSYGKQKLISLARAFMNDGTCLLLDEPMAGVEGPAYDSIQALVREEAAGGKAICVVEHNISFVRALCDSAAFMVDGRIASTGTVEEMIRDPVLTELYFGS